MRSYFEGDTLVRVEYQLLHEKFGCSYLLVVNKCSFNLMHSSMLEQPKLFLESNLWMLFALVVM